MTLDVDQLAAAFAEESSVVLAVLFGLARNAEENVSGKGGLRRRELSL